MEYSSVLSSMKYLVNEVRKEILMPISSSSSQDQEELPPNHLLPTTLACMAALKTWNMGEQNIQKVRYPPAMDEELVKLCVVDHIQRLGLGEHFCKDIDHILKEVYSNLSNKELHPSQTQDLPAKLYKDSLAFRLLRMHGYNVKPCSFSWFLCNEEMLDYIEKNLEHLIGVLYSVYRATDLMFKGEYQLEHARSYSKKFLHKSISCSSTTADDVFKTDKMVEHDLSLPWITRLDHLDHRMWIEQNITSTPQSMGKEYLYRLPCIRNDKLMRLASNNFEFRQSIYAHEMKELARWSEESGLKAIGFGREKSAYCYFASAASTCFPLDSMSRLIMAKTATLITLADDFYDMEGSMTELETLTEAIQRWDGMKLRGHGKAIFTVLDDFVRDTVAKCSHQETDKLTTMFKDIWKEIFGVWMVEKSWSKIGYLPSVEEYLNTGMISIGVHTIVLMAYPSLNPSLPIEKIKGSQYHNTTKLLMLVARLLNDTQGYQRELQEGKINYVSLHQRQYPDAEMEDSVEYMKNMLAEKTKEFVEYVVLMDDDDDMPRSLRQLQLSCMKVFNMFYNSTNAFDSEAGLVSDMINKAFYVPLQSQKTAQEVVP